MDSLYKKLFKLVVLDFYLLKNSIFFMKNITIQVNLGILRKFYEKNLGNLYFHSVPKFLTIRRQ